MKKRYTSIAPGIAPTHQLAKFFESEVLPRLDLHTVFPGVDFTPEAGGERLRGDCCPMCGDQGRPFKVWPDSFTWHCFACNGGQEASGNAFSALNDGIQPTGKRYIEILEQLARSVGLELPERGQPQSPEQRAEQRAKYESEMQRLIDRRSVLAKFYGIAQDALISDIGKPARDYLHERGLADAETLSVFEVGFYPSQAYISDRLDATERAIAKEIGLFRKKLSAAPWLVYPWRDTSGDPLTAYFRRITPIPADADKKENPKTYALPGEASKSTPFGLFQAIRLGNAKQKHGKTEFVVVEGPADVMALWRHGVKNAISYIAALPSSDQCETLLRFRKSSFTLLADNDKVGLDCVKNAAKKLLAISDENKVYIANIERIFKPGEDVAEFFQNRPDDPNAALNLIDGIEKAQSYAEYIGSQIGLAYNGAPAKIRHALEDELLDAAKTIDFDTFVKETAATFRNAAGLTKAEVEPILKAAGGARTEALKYAPAIAHSQITNMQSVAKVENVSSRVAKANKAGNDDAHPASNLPTRPTVVVATDEKRVNDEALLGLIASRKVFQQDGKLVEVKANPAQSRYYVAEIAKARLRELLSEHVEFITLTSKGEHSLAHPPVWCVEALHCRRYWRADNREMPSLNGIITTPVFRPDGTILNTPGWDMATGLYYAPEKKHAAAFAEIPEHPSQAEVAEARDSLLDLVNGFPFETETDRNAWLASLLSPFARPAFTGPMPLHHVDANTPGSGKTLLLKVINAILTGEDMPTMAVSHDDAENEKRISTFIQQGASIQIFDNVSGRFGGKAFDMLLTSDRWQGRKLGSNEQINCPNRTAIYSTGNNIQLLGDMHRRMIRVQLKAEEERPEYRTGFKYPKLEQHARQHRGHYVRACLIILRAWFAAGKPAHGGIEWGSYEGWSEVIRGAVVHCGLSDPAALCASLSSDMGGASDVLGALITGWTDAFGEGEGVTGGELRRLLVKEGSKDDSQHEDLCDAIRELCNLNERETPKARTLSDRLKKFKNRVWGGYRLELRPNGRRGKAHEWAVVRLSASSDNSGNAAITTGIRQVPGSGNIDNNKDAGMPEVPEDYPKDKSPLPVCVPREAGRDMLAERNTSKGRGQIPALPALGSESLRAKGLSVPEARRKPAGRVVSGPVLPEVPALGSDFRSEAPDNASELLAEAGLNGWGWDE